MRAQAEAEAWELEQSSLQLLERDDAGHFYLSEREVHPWVNVLMERSEPLREKLLRASEAGHLDQPGLKDEMGDLMSALAEEMVPEIFTAERRRRLLVDLRDYRGYLFGQREKRLAQYASTAILRLEEDSSLDNNLFLWGICFTSLRAVLGSLSGKAKSGVQDSGRAAATREPEEGQ